MTLVTGSYVNADGTAATGTVKFVPSAIVTLDNDIVISPITVELVNGQFSIDLVATDSTTPAGWTYKVFERITGRAHRWYSIEVTGATLDMSDAVPVAAVDDVSAFVKKTGDSMTGELEISRASENDIALKIVDESAAQADFNIYPGGYLEWLISPSPIALFYNSSTDQLSLNGDFAMDSPVMGIILKDRTTSTQYRLFVNNGVLGIETV